jgi:hypothetical protein
VDEGVERLASWLIESGTVSSSPLLSGRVAS